MRTPTARGHVNNAVFAMMLETGHVEVLIVPEHPPSASGCSFVIVSLTLNFLAEVTWPGRVEIGTAGQKIGRSSVTLMQGLFQEAKRSHPLNDRAIERLGGPILSDPENT